MCLVCATRSNNQAKFWHEECIFFSLPVCTGVDQQDDDD